MLTRRRFITISAALVPSIALGSTGVYVETANALGAKVTLRLDHPQAPQLAALAMAEIRRLESIFSLYLPDSALAQLNRDGVLHQPPFELLDCLTLAGAVHAASGGRFDPTVQPLWRAMAEAVEAGQTPPRPAQGLTGWHKITLAPDAITLERGMALTLNGIAQGYIADRVASLLASHGLSRALIDTGELRAMPEGEWPVNLPNQEISLQDRGLATSSPLGMTFGNDGTTSHIINPESGLPAALNWQNVSISAPSAALADALSTAACLMQSASEIQEMCGRFAGAKVEAAVHI